MIALVVLGALYATFSPLRFARLAAVWGVAALAFVGWRRRTATDRFTWDDVLSPASMVKVSAAAFLFLTLGAYGKAAVARYPDLVFLVRHGVMGDHPSAKWVGVAEFVRRHTAPDATILPLANGDYRWREGLMYEASLRIRTGRSTPLGPRSGVWFDYGKLQQLEADRRHMDRLIDAWRSGDGERVERELEHFRSVDYIIVDERVSRSVQDRLTSYRVETSIGEFTILRRQDRRAGGRTA